MVHSPHCLAEKVQALTLVEWGMPHKRVAEVTNFSVRQLYRLQQTARKRGYDPRISLVIKDEYLTVAPRSGRPKKIRPEKEGAVPTGLDTQPPAPHNGQSTPERVTNNAATAPEMAQHALNQVPHHQSTH
ncbi:hypothetical protein MMC08_003085 [Hypocenomyce scalaris]|nr:hypothetical protein [Hypocenomyce scalaris]